MKRKIYFRIFTSFCCCLLLLFSSSCVKKDEVLPLIESTFCWVEGKTSIYLGSTIYSEGSSQVKNRGVCWNTDSMPTIYNEHTTDGSGGGEFNSRITGLNPGTKYFIRSYARTKIGTSYAGDWSVSTQRNPCAPVVTTSNVTSISATSAQMMGNVIDDGDTTVTARGICWNTEPNPTSAHYHTTDGGGIGPFYSKLTGLSPSLFYYARAYAVNALGTNYGSEFTFTTRDGVALLTTSASSANSSVSAHSGGNISDDGGSIITVRGICFSTTSNPTIASNKTTNGNGTGAFTSWLTGLNSNTIYHVRAYAANEFGTYY